MEIETHVADDDEIRTALKDLVLPDTGEWECSVCNVVTNDGILFFPYGRPEVGVNICKRCSRLLVDRLTELNA